MGDKPPYTITEKAADYLAKIVETVTRLEYSTDFKLDIRLHRNNLVRTIYSSLAIEGNPLTLGEVASVIEGKIVAGKQTEIREVKNAYEAYDKVMEFDPYSVKDFLKAHRLMTQGLVYDAGKFRKEDVGVVNGNITVHIGPRTQFVPNLIQDLLDWAKTSNLHPVLKSAILHYEIEIIHPFSDGNGRMGRLWQTLLLSKWNAIFAWIPMESVMYEKRLQYYRAIENSKRENNSSAFIEFTLAVILDTIGDQVKHIDEHQVELSGTPIDVLKSLNGKTLSRKEIFKRVGMSGDSRAFKRHIEPLLKIGFVEMTVTDKPTSRLQKYRLTESGKVKLRRTGNTQR